MSVAEATEQFHDAIRQVRETLRDLADTARRSAETGDADALRALAEKLRQKTPAGSVLLKHWAGVEAALSRIVDVTLSAPDSDTPPDASDSPSPTRLRIRMLADMTGLHAVQQSLSARRVVASGDVAAMRSLVLSTAGVLLPPTLIQVLNALAAAGALDAEVVECAFRAHPALGYDILGRAAADGSVTRASAACADAVRPFFDELVWKLTSKTEVNFDVVPRGLTLRGLRFVLRALSWSGDPRVADYLGAAELTAAERAALIDHLRTLPTIQQLRAFELRQPAGDADTLLPPLELADAAALLRLIRATSTTEVVRLDRDAIVEAVTRAGLQIAHRLLELLPNELISAAMGWNRPAVEKRVKHNALVGIAAFGLLPLADGETVLDRYLELRRIAKYGPNLGPNRRHSHAAAVEVALDHLAQVAGLPDPSRLEWNCQARIAAEAPGEWSIEGYTVAVRAEGASAVIAVSRAGKRLRSVPAVVRAHSSYVECRARQQRLREQASHMRTGLIEHLVATGGVVEPDELARLRSLPSGSAMLPALIWADRAGNVGLLDQVDTSGSLLAVHPFHLFERGLLAHWQAEVVRLRLTQPVKQAFRELYLLTPAEREAGDRSARFAGHVVDGAVAKQLLSGRGWSLPSKYDRLAVRRPVDGVCAALYCDFGDYFSAGDVTVGEVQFLSGRGDDAVAVPLAEVPPVAFSEVMRDLDLVVSVAGASADPYSSPTHTQSRAQLLGRLVAELGLDRVRVEGASAVVRGSRATYRVHLGSGSIHVEPGGYLCIVPATFGATAHRRLFLPFADDDRLTSVILSKILLLAEDEKITDETILDQINQLVGQGQNGG